MHTVTLAAASNLKGSYETWGPYLLGTPFGRVLATLMLLGCFVIACGIIIGIGTRVIGRTNAIQRAFFPNWWKLIGFGVIALLLSAPLTVGPILGLLDKGIDLLWGVGTDKILNA